ncbi:MAG: DNA polymerase III subunit delta', partial [Deltaproteobacteria bacterium]|nr:DNA polymerase III subunit delta' [Deltaproteobacteria bacterium]
MRFSSIEGQPLALAFLRRMAQGGRVPSGLLFHGPSHVGKRKAALALAAALNCENPTHPPAESPEDGSGWDGCGACPACRKISEGVHPDVELVSADGQFIKIDQIRAITDRLTMNPFSAAKRVIIVDDAERMNPQAANAFLKTLEEPPADTLIILVTGFPTRLPETILSRCMPVRFHLLPRSVLAKALEADHRLKGEELEFALRFCQGRLRPELRENAGRLLALRDDLIHSLERLTDMAFEQVYNRITRWANSEDLDFVLEALETWFHDLALLGGGADETHLINRDKSPALRQWLPHLPPRRAETCHRAVLDVRDQLALHANKVLVLESLWLTP